MSKIKIIILGSSIGGLYAAYILSKYSNKFDITIIEKCSKLSDSITYNEIYDISKRSVSFWHNISNIDTNILSFINEINELYQSDSVPYLSDTAYTSPMYRLLYINNNKHISFLNPFYIIFKNINIFIKKYRILNDEDPPAKDILRLRYIKKYALCICEERLLNYNSISWKDYVSDLSEGVKKWVVYIIAVYLKMDYRKISTYTIFNLIRKSFHTSYNSIYDESLDKMFVTPLLDVFNKRGVKLLFNNEVKKIYHTDNLSTISTIDVLDLEKNITNIYTSNIFINAMDLKSICELYPVNNEFSLLLKNSLFYRTQIIYHMKFKYATNIVKNNVLYLYNTKWLLTIKIETNHTDKIHNDIIICDIGIYDKPGLNGKTAYDCNKKELSEECWRQISESDNNIILTNSNIYNNIAYIDIQRHSIKLSNNINTLEYRLDNRDKNLKNLYHANAYVKSNTSLYNIESCCESGSETAKYIVDKYANNSINSTNIREISNKNKFKRKFKHIRQNYNSIFKCVRKLDQILYVFTKPYFSKSCIDSMV